MTWDSMAEEFLGFVNIYRILDVWKIYGVVCEIRFEFDPVIGVLDYSVRREEGFRF